MRIVLRCLGVVLMAGLLAACDSDRDDEPQGFEVGPLGAVEVGPDEAVQIRSLLAHTVAPSLGPPMRYGVELAVRDFGSIHGHEVELGDPLDGMCSPEGGTAGAKQIIADPQVVGVIGTSCSGAAVAASPLLSDAGLVMVSPSNTSPALTSDLAGNASSDYHPGYFRTANNDLYEAKAVADFAYNELGLRRMVSIDDGDPYTTGLTIAFGNEFPALGGDVALNVSIEKRDVDMTDVLARLAAAEPDGIFFPLFEEEGTPFVEQAQVFEGLEDVTLITSSALLISKFLATMQSEDIYFAGLESDIGSNVNAATGKSADDVLAAYRAMHGEPVSPFWAHAYDAATLLLRALQSVAQVKGETLYVDRAALRREIGATEGFQGLLGTLSCDEFGDCGTGRSNIYHHTDSAVTDPAQLPVVYSFAPSPPVHAVELPSDHGLGNWLENRDTTSASFIVPAGQYRDAGGVRFSCPAVGADCKVTVRGCSNFMAISTGGRASAENNLVKLPDDLPRHFWYDAGDSLTVPAGQCRDVGDVRFSCPADGADCEVTFVSSYCVLCLYENPPYGTLGAHICVDRIAGAVSVGGVVIAELVPLPDGAIMTACQ